jgi:hypothetical protein
MSFDPALLDSTMPDLLQPSKRTRPRPSADRPAKRPHNAYNLYFIERLEVEKSLNPDLTGNEVSQLIGRKWSEMDEEARRPYRERAGDLHAKFREEFPDYHYKKSVDRQHRQKPDRQRLAEQPMVPQRLLEMSLKNVFSYLGAQLIAGCLPRTNGLMDDAATIVRTALATGSLEDSMDLVGIGQ